MFFFEIDEARKQFKTYVNILATIKSEGNEKFLILRKKYYNEVPSEDSVMNTSAGMSSMSPAVSMMSMTSDIGDSPSRPPPPYRLPPQISAPSSPAIQSHVPPSMTTVGLPILEVQTKVQYKDCVNEFQQAMNNFMENRVDVTSRKNSFEQIIDEQTPPSLPPRKRTSIDHRSISRENSVEQPIDRDDNKENIHHDAQASATETDDNKISVREAMMKFNRFASEEEAKIPSPISKPGKKPEKVSWRQQSKQSNFLKFDEDLDRNLSKSNFPPFCFAPSSNDDLLKKNFHELFIDDSAPQHSAQHS